MRQLATPFFVVALLLAWPVGIAEAATFFVNVPDDVDDLNVGNSRCDIDAFATNGDQCTLRAAIQQANALGGRHDIVLTGGRFTLTQTGRDEDAAASGDLDVT